MHLMAAIRAPVVILAAIQPVAKTGGGTGGSTAGGNTGAGNTGAGGNTGGNSGRAACDVFIVEASSLDACPSGATPITSLNDCDRARRDHSMAGYDAGRHGEVCDFGSERHFYDTTNGDVSFNSRQTGTGGSTFRPICIDNPCSASASPSPGASPEASPSPHAHGHHRVRAPSFWTAHVRTSRIAIAASIARGRRHHRMLTAISPWHVARSLIWTAAVTHRQAQHRQRRRHHHGHRRKHRRIEASPSPACSRPSPLPRAPGRS